MKTAGNYRKNPIAAGVALALALSAGPVLAQDDATSDEADDGEIEEVVVLGRFISGSQQLVNERMNDAFATDLLGADTITRLGDSTVGAALRRMPGLTLVQDQFVYIRGLGERYTTATLNGAQIPSPDLTRNVIPLDIFPAAVVESLRVQKSYAPNLSANFGGGTVDIRTKTIPDAFTLRFEGALGYNSEMPSTANSYNGGEDDEWGRDDGTRALSPALLDQIARFQGNFSDENLQNAVRASNPGLTQTEVLFEAQRLRRNLAAELNRDVGVQRVDTHPDYLLRGNVGNKFLLGDSGDWEAGFNIGGQYRKQWRQTIQRTAVVGQPEEENGVATESTENVNLFGTLNLGIDFAGEHSLATTTLWLRDTDDETEVYDFFNENRSALGGSGFRQTRFEYEQREMLTNQITGTHYLGSETKERLPFLNFLGFIPEDASFTWYYSQSDADTDIPNRVQIVSDTVVDDGVVQSASVSVGSTSADYRFTELRDEVEDYGWSVNVPLEWGRSYVELAGGAAHNQKARTYRQTEFLFGYGSESPPETFQGSFDEVFSDQRLFATIPNPDPNVGVPGSEVFLNQFAFNRQGTNTNSYIAATMTDSIWGSVDWTFADTWRVAAGARWEDYRQASVPWNPYGFTLGSPQVNADFESPPESGNITPEGLAEIDSWYFQEDKIYPAIGLTYMGSLWADTFQLRLGYSETQVRPDLREITAASYIDPITGFLTRGKADVRPADVQNLDLRAEWFFANTDQFSITIFDKEIENPIEFFEQRGSDTTISREIQNAASATVQGAEIEFLKELGFLGRWADVFFLQGNFTYQWNRDLNIGPSAPGVNCEPRDAEGNSLETNCLLSGASEYVANLMLGYDSRDSRWSASVIYNTFGERLFAYGLPGRADAFEQPFDSLDFNGFFYPTDQITLQIRIQNILDESVRIQRGTVTVFEEKPGTHISGRFIWSF